jgi:hypothetical protein
MRASARCPPHETGVSFASFRARTAFAHAEQEDGTMLKGGLLWLLGVPLSLVIVLALVGVI